MRRGKNLHHMIFRQVDYLQIQNFKSVYIPQMKRFDSLNESSQSVFLDKKDSPGGRCMVDVPMMASKRL